jgi:hypothetical protein
MRTRTNDADRFALVAVLAALVLAGALGLGTALPAQAAGSGTLYVLQGLAGQTADVAVDGSNVATGVPAKAVVGPLRLSAGKHLVIFTSGGKRLSSAGVTVPAGGSVDVLGYWAAEQPLTARMTVLRNDLSAVGAGKTRLVVTHGIAGPPADIYVNGKLLFRSVANGESLDVTVPSGTYAVNALSTLGGKTLLPKARLTVKAGTLTRAVAIGQPDKPPDVLVHVLAAHGASAGARAPSIVRTGGGGQAAGLFGGPATWLGGLPRLEMALWSGVFLLLALIVALSAGARAGSRSDT